MPHFSLCLLGSFRVTLDDRPVTRFESDKVRALLAYLAVESDRPHRRETLVGLLWPDWPERSARQNLSQALYNLRTVIGDREAEPPLLLITPQTLQFNRESDYWLDTATLTDQPEIATVEELEQAAEACRGWFLTGFSIPDSAPFEEWITATREQLHRLALDTLGRLTIHYEMYNDYERALRHAGRGVELDPCWEPGHRQLMRALALSGQRSAALTQYATCRQLLQDELGTEPSQETQELFDLLLNGEQLPPLPAAPPVPDRPPRSVGASPYRGLAAFREEDAPFFFGREAFVERLIEAVKCQPLVAVVVGSSGSGKSSTIFAGLLPHLRRAEREYWRINDCRPGGQPFHGLAAALVPLLEPDLWETDRLIEIRKLGDVLREGRVHLRRVAERVLEKNPAGSRLLLVVDQFEELYTLCPEPAVRQRFLDELLAAVETESGRREPSFVILLTLRADFMGQVLAHRPFADALQDASIIMGPMTRDELHAAIEKPAEKQGAAFEEGLVERILDDVGQEPGNLPLLEFALTLLWEQQSYGWLTHAGYEEIGRVEGALARYADQVYEELEEAEREGARQLFVQLVRPGEGTEDTRRVATWNEIGEANWGLVRRLADRRLVITGQEAGTGSETVEVVHEALIQGWGQLAGWMEADRAFRTWQERLRAAMRGWEASERDQGALLRGAPLLEAENWLAERGSELSRAEVDYFQAGAALRELQTAEREVQRQRELDAAQKLAEERTRSATRLRRRAVWLGLALILALVAAAVAGVFVDRNATLAGQKADIALTAQAASTRAVGEQAMAQTAGAEEALQRATAESAEALERLQRATAEAASTRAFEERSAAQTAQAQEAVQRATAEAATLLEAEQREEAERQARIALSRELAAVALDSLEQDQELAVLLAIQALNQAHTNEAEDALHRTAQDLRLLHTLDSPGKSTWVATSPDGRRYVSSGDGGAAVWDADTGELIYSIDISEGWINRSAFSPDSALLVTPNEGGDPFTEGTVGIYDAETGDELLIFPAHDAWVQDVSFSPDGTLLATAGGDGVARIWDLAATLAAGDGQEQLVLPVDENALFLVEFSSDGSLLATASGNDIIRIWDASTGQELWHTTSDLFDVAFSPDGTRLVTGAGIGVLAIHDALSGQLLSRALAHSGNIHSVMFAPDGTRVGTTSGDSTVKVWTFSEDILSPLLTLTGHKVRTVSLGFSPDGERLVSGSADGTVRVWDISPDGSVEPILYPHGAPLNGVAFHPDGTRLATAGAGGAARIWDLATGESLNTLSSDDWIWRVSYSPDGALLASAGRDATVKLWDAESGQEISSLTGLPQQDVGWFFRGVLAAAFSPDGAWLATAGGDGAIRIWDVASLQEGDLEAGDELFFLQEPAELDWSYDLAFSADGRWIAASINTYGAGGQFRDGDGVVKVWDAATRQLVWALGLEDGQNPGNISFSPAGDRLAVGHMTGGRATVWALPDDPATTPEELFTLVAGKEFVHSLNFSPDGSQLAVPHPDGMGIWDADTGEFVKTLPHPFMVLEAVYSPDGKSLVTAGFDGFGRLFILDLDELMTLAESRLTRTLTAEECQQFLHMEHCP